MKAARMSLWLMAAGALVAPGVAQASRYLTRPPAALARIACALSET
jgi:hypothetical protein